MFFFSLITFHLNVSIFVVVTCASEDTSHASRTPNQTEYDYNTNVVYSCDVGFNLTAGDPTRTCLASRTWSGTAPTCSCMFTFALAVCHFIFVPSVMNLFHCFRFFMIPSRICVI